jgi:putative ATP-binding cassette transporter
VRTTNALQTAEANFRFGLARAREHAEAIALMRGEPLERSGAVRRFGQIMRDWNLQSFAYMGIVGFSTGYGTLLPVFPILIAAPQYILGAMSLGMLMQAAQAFQKLTSSLSWLTDNHGDIARTRASAERVLSLHEAIRQLEEDVGQPEGSRILLERGPSSRLVIDDLSIAEPSGSVLIDNFSARIARGERVLIAGDPAVTGSLFKVIAGLWPWGRGRVLLPGEDGMLFMSQRPFIPEGTLRAAIAYPRRPEDFAAAAICRALECSGVAWLAPRLDDIDNWEQALPLRVQQRLGFARALLQRPPWILMEEATDAFDPRGEQLILEMLYRELPNTGFLTITFHAGLDRLHTRKLVLHRREPSAAAPAPP